MRIGAGSGEHLALMERPNKISIEDRGGFRGGSLIGFRDGGGRAGCSSGKRVGCVRVIFRSGGWVPGRVTRRVAGWVLLQDSCNLMEIEVQSKCEPLVAHQIEEIDTKGYLIDHDNSEYESDNKNDDDIDVGLEKDECNDVTNEAYGRKFVCNKEGFKDLKGKGPDGGDKKWCMDLRTRCEAFLRINISKDRKWFVKEFKNAHNHELTITPTKVMKYRSHRKFHRSMACKSLMSELSHSGLKPCHIKKVVNSMKNPLEPDVTSKQCVDVISEERKQYKGNDTA
uniref:FAR1 domain-containing protein n=1 Tax=Tanacetum cinerariifolium TaxID=118510 RepID=A0A6L2JS68_TANCI|nr:hypothetical protein [Tanacetum cinerariifolium]